MAALDLPLNLTVSQINYLHAPKLLMMTVRNRKLERLDEYLACLCTASGHVDRRTSLDRSATGNSMDVTYALNSIQPRQLLVYVQELTGWAVLTPLVNLLLNIHNV